MLKRLRTDFRLSIITLLGASALLGITPFAIMRFLQGNFVAGSIDTSILLSICGVMAYAWITGDTRRSGMVLAVIACSGAVAVAAVVGEVGLFWLYPCLVTAFFLVSPRIATFLNLVSIAAMTALGDVFQSDVQMWTFTATALVVSATAFAFAHRTDNQRERLEHLATIDPLTGVKNRRSMDEELNLAGAHAERSGLSYALVMLDIDHFKKVNDEYGHGVGDVVLVDLVTLIQQSTRKSDQLFRYGGEEFVLLLPGVDGAGLTAVMNNLQHIMRKKMRHPGGAISASFGVALLGPGESIESWLERADTALYEAKETGRDRVVFSDNMSAADADVSVGSPELAG
ncbi:diguanylate cyclase (GGDEF) domain-containing protein [Marinobacter antarcticus]|uniref:diguanylate cyclase n=1 Tax=Marinobacter antarcticus TaxID=564117 RepID=A0A1M6PN45_9GAMM|nr:GGDEF domain-containing protein [Marinobacter antarcticus]SHK09332.1 diguanylate cyclase (GGDEF) domain-containing protein [Marinobacter antarcticus]